MSPRGRLVSILAASILAGGALGALAPATTLDGAAEDAAAALRATVFGGGFAAPQVALVLLDEESAASPRLAATPRALMAPVWAELAETALAHGARAVGFDFIFAFDAAEFRIG